MERLLIKMAYGRPFKLRQPGQYTFLKGKANRDYNVFVYFSLAPF